MAADGIGKPKNKYHQSGIGKYGNPSEDLGLLPEHGPISLCERSKKTFLENLKMLSGRLVPGKESRPIETFLLQILA